MSFLTIKQQKLLIQMYENNCEITKSEQDIYSSHSFYEKMQHLKNLGLIKSQVFKNGNGKGFKPLNYYLTNRGLTLVKVLSGENWLC